MEPWISFELPMWRRVKTDECSILCVDLQYALYPRAAAMNDFSFPAELFTDKDFEDLFLHAELRIMQAWIFSEAFRVYTVIRAQ